MNDSSRLTYLSDISEADKDELWENCFGSIENINHINRYVPYRLENQYLLNGFLAVNNKYKFWLIKRKLEKDIIGFLIQGSFFPGNENDIGFNIGLNYIRKGYASEALGALISHIREVGLKETYGHCFESNIPSIRTMEKCGFENLGRTGEQYSGNYVLEFIRRL